MEPALGPQVRNIPSRRAVAAFIGLAVLTGPITTYVFTPVLFAVGWQTPTSAALSSILASAVLLIACITRKQSQLRAKQWLALLALLLPQWALSILAPPFVRSLPWLHQTGWGVVFLLSLASPLWLALLSALQLISVEVPRKVAGAAIAGIAAVCLVIPTDAFRVAANQAPVLALQILLSIIVVFTWAYSAPRLAGAGTLAVAGTYLLLSACGNAGLSLVFDRSSWQPFAWREMALPLLVQSAVMACSWCLWFWLLQRISLGALGMRALATWTASIIPGFALLGFLSWRVDLALAIAVAAIAVSLRAPRQEEQQVTLGLSAN